MTEARRNVELKATDPDPARSLGVCRALGASDEGELWQRDTYYAVASGRLKLREQEPGRPHLIHYARADRPEQRESRYRIAEVADGAATHVALEAALGVECVVVKRRRLFLWNDVRIHLDRVDGLGAFVELEAVAPPASDLTLEHERIATLREALAIADDRLVPHGYAALLRARGA
ncbi:MAG TPA: class IV adenylate cyclase [Conexibacter sp.]|nr:class IV adenylate cyclase [Conexibacter sp.]